MTFPHEPPVRIYHHAQPALFEEPRGLPVDRDDNGIVAEVIDYLKTPPDREELRRLLIACSACGQVRTRAPRRAGLVETFQGTLRGAYPGRRAMAGSR
jgi:hypothetical protein